MNHEAIIRRLNAFPAAVEAATAGLTEAEVRHSPASGAWSIVAIVCHLADEERDDFRARLRSTLTDPAAAWLPIDPEGWAKARGYARKGLRASLDDFARERAASIAWLRGLGPVDWTTAHHHPKFGVIHAGDLLAAWAAHDALHLRQIAKRRFELAAADAPEFSTRYAGEWGP